MKQEIEIVVPTDWSAIPLKTYLKFREDCKSYEDNEDALEALMFHHLCGVKAEWINRLDLETYTNIRKDLAKFMAGNQLPLQQFVTIDGVEYGFEPNLSKMSYGAYLDIAKYESIEIDEKWADIMSILYRPVTQKVSKFYDIKEYEGNIDSTKWLEVGMDVHWGAVFFFKDLLADLLKNIQKSLMKDLGAISPNIKSILQRNGNLMGL
jgi:hypothetical protein